MVKKIHNISIYALLISVYTVFFSVQVFFNFDFPGSGNAKNLFRDFCSINHPEKTANFVKGATSHSCSYSIRLNKRFHEESSPTCDSISMDVPEPYMILRTLGHYKDSFLSSITPVHRLLRGPPALA
jgi:hypothetical protein